MNTVERKNLLAGKTQEQIIKFLNRHEHDRVTLQLQCRGNLFPYAKVEGTLYPGPRDNWPNVFTVSLGTAGHISFDTQDGSLKEIVVDLDARLLIRVELP